MDTSMTLGASAGAIAFLLVITFWIWIDSRNKRHERDVKHAERIKALELGQPLPDAEIAKAGAELGRAWALGLTCTFVPLGMLGIALGATALLFDQASTSLQLPLACVIWGVAGVVSIVTVSCSMGAMARKPHYSSSEQKENLSRDKSTAEELDRYQEMHAEV